MLTQLQIDDLSEEPEEAFVEAERIIRARLSITDDPIDLPRLMAKHYKNAIVVVAQCVGLNLPDQVWFQQKDEGDWAEHAVHFTDNLRWIEDFADENTDGRHGPTWP